MQILNSKAFYLKNYSVRPRAKSEPRPRLPQLPQQPRLEDILRIRNIASNTTMESFMPKINASKEIPEQQRHHGSRLQSIYQREQDLLLKVYRSHKNENPPRRYHSVSVGEDILVQKHPIAQVNSLQFESMKPTNRYFHKVENIRLAERLLLARPSRDINRSSQEKFFQQQAVYRFNISKLSFRGQPSGRHRKLHRKKWVD